MKTGASVSILAVLASLTSLALAQEGAPPAPEPPAGAAAPAAAPAAAAPPPATAPAPMGPAAPAPAPSEGGARTHDGFFFRIGLNGGPLMLTADVNPEIKYSGFQSGFDLMFGGSPMPGLAIGGALIAARTTDPDVEQGPLTGKLEGSLLFAGVGVFADYYLDPHKGLHFQGMLGFATVDFVSDSGNSGGNDPTGMMFGIGAGYDFWIGDEWSIGPFGRVIYSPMSADSGGTSVKFSYLYPSIGLAFTLH